MLVLSGSLKVTNPRTGQTTLLKEGSHFLLPAKCPFTLLALQETRVFFISELDMGFERVLTRQV